MVDRDDLRRWVTNDVPQATRGVGARLQAFLQSRRGRELLALGGGVLVVVLVLYLSYQWNGLVDTIIYVTLFIAAFSIMPIIIGIFGAEIWGNHLLAKLHEILGAAAFGYHYLVDRGDRWERWPGDADRIWVDKEWHDIVGGFDNRTVLGWQPFGITRYKDEDTFRKARVDEQARHRDAVKGDGGTVERAGFDQVDPPIESGLDGTWIVDLKRIMTPGVRRMADVDIIETAEEIIERREVGNRGQGTRINPLVTGGVALLLGITTGLVYLWLV